jgi:hypothetical protein
MEASRKIFTFYNKWIRRPTKMITLIELENRFLPVFRKMATEISAEFPRVHTNVWSYPVGALTDYQGHGLGVECSIPTNLAEPVDQAQMEFVALMINLKHLSTQPEIDSVLVSWGSGQVEEKMTPQSGEINIARLVEVDKGLPELFEVLKTAIRRGHPATE